MSGITYPRVDGTGVTAASASAVAALPGLDPNEIIPPGFRDPRSGLSEDDKQAYLAQQLDALQAVPSFLKFGLADPAVGDPVAGSLAPTAYPGSVPAPYGQNLQDGYLSQPNQLVRINQELDRRRGDAEALIAAGLLNPARGPRPWSEAYLQGKLATFTGLVNIDRLSAGEKLYRIVGLTVRKSGQVVVSTNVRLGDFWMREHPSTFATHAEWRAKTAVLMTWNGNYGYVEVELARDLMVLQGRVSQQPIPGTGLCLPGGGNQVLVPYLTDKDLVLPVDGRSLIDTIRPTNWK